MVFTLIMDGRFWQTVADTNYGSRRLHTFLKPHCILISFSYDILWGGDAVAHVAYRA